MMFRRVFCADDERERERALGFFDSTGRFFVRAAVVGVTVLVLLQLLLALPSVAGRLSYTLRLYGEPHVLPPHRSLRNSGLDDRG